MDTLTLLVICAVVINGIFTSKALVSQSSQLVNHQWWVLAWTVGMSVGVIYYLPTMYVVGTFLNVPVYMITCHWLKKMGVEAPI